jgi:hypothetical protein
VDGRIAQSGPPPADAGRSVRSCAAEQLAAALAALDANDKDSLLNRLVEQTSRALAQQSDLLREVRETVARLETRRQEQARSPRGGLEFEEEVVGFVERAVRGMAAVAERTASSNGTVGRCKVGDLVLRFDADSAFNGAGLVVEAKHHAGYTVARALEELDLARKNRDADAGLFVLARSHAPEGFPPFARHGNSVLVLWDPDDAGTDPRLEAALSCALALAPRRKAARDEGDLQALSDVRQRIEQELKRLDGIAAANERIRTSSEAIADEVRKGQKKLATLLGKAKECLAALRVEFDGEEEEQASPIALAPFGGDAA